MFSLEAHDDHASHQQGLVFYLRDGSLAPSQRATLPCPDRSPVSRQDPRLGWRATGRYDLLLNWPGALSLRPGAANAGLLLESTGSSIYDQYILFKDPGSEWYLGNKWGGGDYHGFGMGRTAEKNDLVIASNGDLGLGFGSPTSAVHVWRDGANSILTLESTQNSQFDQAIRFVDPTSQWYVGNLWTGDSIDGFGIGRDSEKRDFRIDALGRIGLGHSAPTSAAHLWRDGANSVFTIESTQSSQFDQAIRFVDTGSDWHVGNIWTGDLIDGFGVGRGLREARLPDQRSGVRRYRNESGRRAVRERICRHLRSRQRTYLRGWIGAVHRDRSGA